MIELNDKEMKLVSAAGLNPLQDGFKIGSFEWESNFLDLSLLQTSLTAGGVLVGLACHQNNPLEGILSGGLIGALALPMTWALFKVADDIWG